MGTVITKATKEPNNRVLQGGGGGGGLYCLVVLFLLLYVICASVPTEGTHLLVIYEENLLEMYLTYKIGIWNPL